MRSAISIFERLNANQTRDDEMACTRALVIAALAGLATFGVLAALAHRFLYDRLGAALTWLLPALAGVALAVGLYAVLAMRKPAALVATARPVRSPPGPTVYATAEEEEPIRSATFYRTSTPYIGRSPVANKDNDEVARERSAKQEIRERINALASLT